MLDVRYGTLRASAAVSGNEPLSTIILMTSKIIITMGHDTNVLTVHTSVKQQQVELRDHLQSMNSMI